MIVADSKGDIHDGPLAALLMRDEDVKLRPDGREQVSNPVRVAVHSSPYILGSVEAGSYRLSLVKPDVLQRELRVEIVEGQDRSVPLDLVR